MTAVWNPGETVRLLREATEILHNANEEAMSDTPRYDALHKEANEETARFCATDGTLRVWEALEKTERELALANAKYEELKTAAGRVVAWLQDSAEDAVPDRDWERYFIACGGKR